MPQTKSPRKATMIMTRPSYSTYDTNRQNYYSRQMVAWKIVVASWHDRRGLWSDCNLGWPSFNVYQWNPPSCYNHSLRARSAGLELLGHYLTANFSVVQCYYEYNCHWFSVVMALVSLYYIVMNDKFDFINTLSSVLFSRELSVCAFFGLCLRMVRSLIEMTLKKG